MTTPPAALLVLPWLELAGAERQALHHARHLKSRGWRVCVWGIDARVGPVAEACDGDGIPWRAGVFRRSTNRLRDARNHLRFALQMRRERPTVIVSYTTAPNLACGWSWRLTGAASCVWNQRDEGLGLLQPTAYQKGAVRLVPRFVSNSARGAAALGSAFGVPMDRISLVPNAVALDPAIADPPGWRRRLGAERGTFVATMIAHVHRNKDHATLVKAWCRVAAACRERGERALLVLAGRVEEGEATLRALVAAGGAGEDVLFLGEVDDVSGLLAASDVGVFSSRSEGVPNGVLECMAAGLPVVATEIPGIREAVGPALASLCAPGDDEAFAARVLELLRDPALRAARGAAGRERVARVYAPQVALSRLEDVVRDAAGRGPSPSPELHAPDSSTR